MSKWSSFLWNEKPCGSVSLSNVDIWNTVIEEFLLWKLLENLFQWKQKPSLVLIIERLARPEAPRELLHRSDVWKIGILKNLESILERLKAKKNRIVSETDHTHYFGPLNSPKSLKSTLFITTKRSDEIAINPHTRG